MAMLQALLSQRVSQDISADWLDSLLGVNSRGSVDGKRYAVADGADARRRDFRSVAHSSNATDETMFGKQEP